MYLNGQKMGLHSKCEPEPLCEESKKHIHMYYEFTQIAMNNNNIIIPHSHCYYLIYGIRPSQLVEN